MSLLGEIKRRKVFQVAAVYAVVAWLTIQIVDVVSEPLSLPDWFDTVVIVLFAVGFPIAVILAWAFDITPQGIKTASEVHSSDISQATGQQLNYITHGLVLLAVGVLLANQYVFQSGSGADDSNTGSVGSSAEVRRFPTSLGPTERMGNTGLSAQIALSKDGSRLVYALRQKGAHRLYLRNLDELEARLMPDTLGATHPTFSPDGESVVFFSDYGDQTLKIVSVHGGPAESLVDTPSASGAHWSSSDAIYYATQDGNGTRGLYRIAAEGGTPELLAAPVGETGHVWPEVLPGNEAVLLSVRPGGGAGGGAGGSGNARDGYIAILDLETREIRMLIRGGFRPRYVPTGHIAFVRGGALWAIPFDLETRELVGNEVELIDGVQQDGFIGGAPYDFSDDGMLIYVPGEDESRTAGNARRLVWVDRQGIGVDLPIPAGPYLYPRLSPTGSHVAVSLLNDAADIWIYDVERGTPRQLTIDPAAFDSNPIWDPDGEYIVFHSTRDGGGLFRKAADGSGRAEPIRMHPAIQIAGQFSADGNRLVLQIGNPSDLQVLSLNDEPSAQPLVTSPFYLGPAAISPDQNWLAYESNETGRSEVWVRRFDVENGGQQRVSLRGGEEPLWGPNGDELFYLSEGAVMVAKVNGTGSFEVESRNVLFTGTFDLSAEDRNYDVAPDGNRFLMMKELGPAGQNENTELVFVHNWFEELRQNVPRR